MLRFPFETRFWSKRLVNMVKPTDNPLTMVSFLSLKICKLYRKAHPGQVLKIPKVSTMVIEPMCFGPKRALRVG